MKKPCIRCGIPHSWGHRCRVCGWWVMFHRDGSGEYHLAGYGMNMPVPEGCLLILAEERL